MIYPKLEEARQYAETYAKIPLALEIRADTCTPINLFQRFEANSKSCFLLESAENAEQWGRYSFIGFDPLKEIQIRSNEIYCTEKENDPVRIPAEDPLTFLEKLLEENKAPKIKGLPPLTGGLIGYFAYDAVRYVEKKLSCPPKDDLGLPDCHFLLCDELLALDHFRHSLFVIVNIPTSGDIDGNYEEGVRRAREIAQRLDRPFVPFTGEQPTGELTIRSNMDPETFCQKVLQAKKHITDGDIFQIVLSQRLEAENPPEAFSVYRTLRQINPSPYMYYFKFEGYRIAGASPEMLISVTDGEVLTRPIAGTIRRGTTREEDLMLEQAMLNDPKELAEHTMLLDLGRNDIGKVSQFGTVEVTRKMAVERYSSVMHIVSDVRGKLRKDKTGMDALAAVIPAGTLSGAPKIRAMELIDEIEPSKRCLYGGTVGYLGFDGGIDTCIAIRTILFRHDRAYIQAGAGIVADSVPEKEFEETLNKAEAMAQALKKAREVS